MSTILDSEVPWTISCLHFVNVVCDSFANSSIKSPLFLLILWWLLCLNFQFIVLNLFPLFILIWFSFKWKKVKKEQLEPMDLHQLLIRFEEKLEATKYLSWERGHARKSFIYSVSAYFIWISLQQVLALSTLFILVGSTFIVWESESFLQIKRSYIAIENRFTRDKSQERLWERVRNFNQGDQQKPTFLFEIFENQRFNFFNNQWEDTIFPFERGPWTDSAHYPVSSKSQITLPYFWDWIDDDWSADLWSYSTVIWTTNRGNRWYHNKTRRRMWSRTASTMNNGSSRRRSSVFYSQKSVSIEESPFEEKPADHYIFNDQQDALHGKIFYGSDYIEQIPPTPPATEKKVDSKETATIPKPPHDILCNDSEYVITASIGNHSTTVQKEKNEYTSFHRRSKRLSSTTTSRDAIWKSIAKV